jgi:hypothetical protein
MTIAGVLAIVVGWLLVFFVAMPMALVGLWRRLMPRAILYVKAQYPDSWHLASTSGWLWFCAILSIIGTLVITGTIADVADIAHVQPNSLTIQVVCTSMLVLFAAGFWAAAFALRLKDRLRAQVPHTFIPQWGLIHSTVALIAISAPGMPEPIQSWINERVVPIERSWRCEVCGQIERSPKHARGSRS